MSRLLLVFLLLFGCAHASRATDPALWLEVQTEHFSLRTDLPPGDAREAAAELESLRAALLAASWHGQKLPVERTQVVELASERELREFAEKGYLGFVASDAFEEPIMVVNASGDAQELLKHELSHVITRGYLVSKPRWVDEGLACYFETLKLDGSGKFSVGALSRNRMLFLQQFPVLDYASVFHTGREAETMDAQAGYAYETAAWLVVHFLIDTRAQQFDAFLNRLAQGEPADRAFHTEFVDLDEATLRATIRDYWKSGAALIGKGKTAPWTGDVEVRPMDPAEVWALRADLLRLSPGFNPAEHREQKQAEIAKALAIDPGNPRALELSRDADPQPAVAAHPDDWRTWMLVSDRKKDPQAIDRAAKLAPENAGVLGRLAIAQIGRGAVKAALGTASRAAELAPWRSDVLDALAQSLGANGQCGEAFGVEQRAIDALPDAAGPGAVAELQKRMVFIGEHCGTSASIERRVMTQPVRKGCTRAMPSATPRDRVRTPITAEFTIREDGTVGDVTMKGEASARLVNAMKKYIESCTFEPTIDQGKPIQVKTDAQFTFGAGLSK